MMPLFMAWIAATLPAGLPIYWIMFNILGILQQLYVNKTSQGLKPQVEIPETEAKPTAEIKPIEKKNIVKESANPQKGQKETAKKNISKKDKAVGSDKGGKKNNGRPGTNNRKKKKKR